MQFLNFLSGVEWLCQPDITAEEKKAFWLGKEKPEIQTYKKAAGLCTPGRQGLSYNPRPEIRSTAVRLCSVARWVYLGRGTGWDVVEFVELFFTY